jgi:hypothetical protein
MPATNVALISYTTRSKLELGTVNRSTSFASRRKKVQLRLKFFQERVEPMATAISSTTDSARQSR